MVQTTLNCCALRASWALVQKPGRCRRGPMTSCEPRQPDAQHLPHFFNNISRGPVANASFLSFVKSCCLLITLATYLHASTRKASDAGETIVVPEIGGRPGVERAQQGSSGLYRSSAGDTILLDTSRGSINPAPSIHHNPLPASSYDSRVGFALLKHRLAFNL